VDSRDLGRIGEEKADESGGRPDDSSANVDTEEKKQGASRSENPCA